jgi:hypothetical protein
LKGVTGVHCRVVHKNGSFYIEDKSAAWHFDTLITKVISLPTEYFGLKYPYGVNSLDWHIPTG